MLTCVYLFSLVQALNYSREAESEYREDLNAPRQPVSVDQSSDSMLAESGARLYNQDQAVLNACEEQQNEHPAVSTCPPP